MALQDIEADTEAGYKQAFLQEIFHSRRFRKISRSEACLIQGFPPDFQLPESRSRWMRLVGNSVSALRHPNVGAGNHGDRLFRIATFLQGGCLIMSSGYHHSPRRLPAGLPGYL
ncbi:MAG: DNA cytosine methyltransferase [Thiolinea sp.]